MLVLLIYNYDDLLFSEAKYYGMLLRKYDSYLLNYRSIGMFYR